MTLLGRRYLVAGMVQGVGYRAFVRRSASSLGLRGCARNLPDGTVEVLVCGPGAAVVALEAELRQGPPHALVTEVSSSEVDSQVISNKTFEIN